MGASRAANSIDAREPPFSPRTVRRRQSFRQAALIKDASNWGSADHQPGEQDDDAANEDASCEIEGVP
jgi:hypothetical protein